MTIKERVYKRLLELSTLNDEYRAHGNTSIEAKTLEIPETQFIRILRQLKIEGKIAALYMVGTGDFSMIVHKSE